MQNSFLYNFNIHEVLIIKLFWILDMLLDYIVKCSSHKTDKVINMMNGVYNNK